MTAKSGYWIGGGLIGLAVIGAIVWSFVAVFGVAGMVDDFQRVEVPGSAMVRLDARKYVLYVGGPEARDDPPEIEYAVVNPRTGRRLRLASYESALNYAFDTSGSADRTVSPRRAGTYELRAADSRVAPGRYVVAIGESIAAELFVAIVGALAFGAVFGIAGATM